MPPELKLRPTVRTSNGQPVPYSHGYVPGEKRTALRVYSSAPVSKIGLDRAHGGNTTNAGGSIRANFFDFNFAGLLATYWLPVVKVTICPRCCRYSALVRSTRI